MSSIQGVSHSSDRDRPVSGPSDAVAVDEIQELAGEAGGGELVGPRRAASAWAWRASGSCIRPVVIAISSERARQWSPSTPSRTISAGPAAPNTSGTAPAAIASTTRDAEVLEAVGVALRILAEPGAVPVDRRLAEQLLDDRARAR